MTSTPEYVATAERIARKAHGGEVDKVGADYIGHPERVAARVARESGPEEIAAAWLHDVLEDTPVTSEDLRADGIPDPVITAVEALTRRTPDDGDAYYLRVRANEIALAVKLADIADNTDPDRVAKLPAEDRDRLRDKYEHALEQLGVR